jgi:hypothetical protein
MHRGAAAIRYGVANLFGSEKDRGVDKDYLILKRASASRRPSGQWNEEDFDVLANGELVGRIFKANAAPVGSPWMWTLAFEQPESHADTRLRRKPRGRYGCIRQELAAGVKESPGCAGASSQRKEETP